MKAISSTVRQDEWVGFHNYERMLTDIFKSVYFLPALTSVVAAGTIFRLMFGESKISYKCLAFGI